MKELSGIWWWFSGSSIGAEGFIASMQLVCVGMFATLEAEDEDQLLEDAFRQVI